ncbi:hypothetical protein IAR50_007221 [Cryptococcus sp. DSM 104548]
MSALVARAPACRTKNDLYKWPVTVKEVLKGAKYLENERQHHNGIHVDPALFCNLIQDPDFDLCPVHIAQKAFPPDVPLDDVITAKQIMPPWCHNQSQ